MEKREIEKKLVLELSKRDISINGKMDIKRRTLNRILQNMEVPTLNDIACDLNFPPTFQSLLKYVQKNYGLNTDIEGVALLDQTCFLAESYENGKFSGCKY